MYLLLADVDWQRGYSANHAEIQKPMTIQADVPMLYMGRTRASKQRSNAVRLKCNYIIDSCYCERDADEAGGGAIADNAITFRRVNFRSC